ncbi:MAG: cyclic nucleotide-binding domain-containing protein [Pseudomonadota bacterium]
MNILVDLANVTYVISYSVRDVLWLRIFAVLGGILLLPYYYLQPTPLMVPIYWGIGFIALNLFWVTLLILERRPVKLTDEEQRLYRLVFRTLTPREMLKLLKLARWEDKAAGDVLVREGESLQRLSIIVSGKAAVHQNGQQVGELLEGQFVGDVSFMIDQIAPVTIIASEPVRQVSWHRGELRNFLKNKKELLAALQLIMGINLGLLLQSAWAQQGKTAPNT